jgi:tRNA(Arg) A34 adenosine deaminase TadA
MNELADPMRQALELAWESARAGSLGIGAVITNGNGDTIATGRNRLAEHDAGDDHLAGTSLAHAELNALAKLRWGAHGQDELVLWTTLEPCLQCAGAIRMAPITEVHVLAPDPLFPDMDRMRDINPFVAAQWPAYHRHPADAFAVFALVLQTHTFAYWGAQLPGWSAALPRVTALAQSLVDSGELIAFATDRAELDVVLEALWTRLVPAVGDVAELWAR